MCTTVVSSGGAIMVSYLRKRGKRFHFRKRVPKAYQKYFSKPVIQVPLDTDSEVIALQRAGNFNLLLDDFWKDFALSKENTIHEQFQEVVLKAKMCGFQYITKQELVTQSSLTDFVNRINRADSSADKQTKTALLGGVEKPVIYLSKAQDEYFAYEAGNKNEYSENQLKKWTNPRKKAIRNFIDLIGNQPISAITRKEMLEFRNWWIERITQEGLSSNSANKEFGFIRQIMALANDNYHLDLTIDQLFKNIRLKETEKNTRYPFSVDFIKKTLLQSQNGLNEEARLLIYAMADTGARISELTGLEAADVILDGVIPHIKIRPNQTRALKTPQSERDIPLVGVSLYAFRKLGGTFKRYHGKPDLISSTINKYFRENDLLSSKHHSLYSLRHSFEDRLTAVEPPDKVQAALMGHKYVRPRYGSGPSLEQKRLWLDRIAFQM
ncbi:MAG: hypothetical protein BM557_06255 [Flavobacterium sp. MedPE-SWcel]|uniref:DUF6538 domain-containing protein n=1 Tax=uncultured Flavobacterium sp. TaxID=165435 RepID=UPI0009126D85|nr:DUF6538 domain-containing protein [uncultured Flavobacterium sp.]OIQ19304.1 MAG: hypothetical protein BM557_06255 [Flavobacterium sp. MedPE-SWcel]